MLKLEDVNTYYGHSHVLFDVSFNVNRNEIVALLGRNGVGKTTSLRTIMGLTPPRNGSIAFKGNEIAGKKAHQIAKAGIGLVPEERWIFNNLTVNQNLIMGIKPGQNDVLSTLTEHWALIQGAIFVLLVMYAPNGLSGVLIKLKEMIFSRKTVN